MLALYRSGRQAEALDAYQRARDRLTDELGLEPGSELRALQAAILQPGSPRSRLSARVSRPGSTPADGSVRAGRDRSAAGRE